MNRLIIIIFISLYIFSNEKLYCQSNDDKAIEILDKMSGFYKKMESFSSMFGIATFDLSKPFPWSGTLISKVSP